MQVKIKKVDCYGAAGEVLKVRRLSDFAEDCNRHRSQIETAIKNEELDYGEVLGVKVVILNSKADSYKYLCQQRDKLRSK